MADPRVAPGEPQRARAKWDPLTLLPQWLRLREGVSG